MLNQTTYRLWLRNAIDQTGLGGGANIDAAVAAIAAAAIVANLYDTQD
jgi:hypothetical protein